MTGNKAVRGLVTNVLWFPMAMFWYITALEGLDLLLVFHQNYLLGSSCRVPELCILRTMVLIYAGRKQKTDRLITCCRHLRFSDPSLFYTCFRRINLTESAENAGLIFPAQCMCLLIEHSSLITFASRQHELTTRQHAPLRFHHWRFYIRDRSMLGSDIYSAKRQEKTDRKVG